MKKCVLLFSIDMPLTFCHTALPTLPKNKKKNANESVCSPFLYFLHFIVKNIFGGFEA